MKPMNPSHDQPAVSLSPLTTTDFTMSQSPARRPPPAAPRSPAPPPSRLVRAGSMPPPPPSARRAKSIDASAGVTAETTAAAAAAPSQSPVSTQPAPSFELSNNPLFAAAESKTDQSAGSASTETVSASVAAPVQAVSAGPAEVKSELKSVESTPTVTPASPTASASVPAVDLTDRLALLRSAISEINPQNAQPDEIVAVLRRIQTLATVDPAVETVAPVETSPAVAPVVVKPVQSSAPVVEQSIVVVVARDEDVKAVEVPVATIALASDTGADADDTEGCCASCEDHSDPQVHFLLPTRILAILILACAIGNIAAGFSVFTYFTTVNSGAWWAAIAPLFTAGLAGYGGKRSIQYAAMFFAFAGCVTGIVGAALDGQSLQTFHGYQSCTVNAVSSSLCDCVSTSATVQYQLTSTSPFYTHTCSTILSSTGFIRTLGASVAFCSLQVIFNAMLIGLLVASMSERVRRAITCNGCVSEYQEPESSVVANANAEPVTQPQVLMGLDYSESKAVENVFAMRVVAVVVAIFAVGQLAAGMSSFTFFTNVWSGAWWACILPSMAALLALIAKTRLQILLSFFFAVLGAATSVVGAAVDGTSAMTFNFYIACSATDPSGRNCLCTDGQATLTYPVATSSPWFSRSCATILSNTGYLGTIKASTAFSAMQCIATSVLVLMVLMSLNKRCQWWWSCDQSTEATVADAKPEIELSA